MAVLPGGIWGGQGWGNLTWPSGQYPRYGYRRIRIFLRRQGFKLSWSRTHRIWRQAGLLLPKKRSRKRIASGRPRSHTPFKVSMVWA